MELYFLNDAHLFAVARRNTETKLKKLEGEREMMKQQIQEANKSYQQLEEELRLVTNERDQTIQEKRNLEVNLSYLTLIRGNSIP